MIQLDPQTFTIDAAETDGQARRTISGIAVRYNVAATVADGTSVMFAPGSLPSDGPAPKLFLFHDPTKIIGQVTERQETEQGMLFVAKISETTLGNEALVLASDGSISEVSVGIDAKKFKYDKNGTMVITSAVWRELSLVAHGAFDAPILDVAASIPDNDDPIDNNNGMTSKGENEMENVKDIPAVIEAPVVTASVYAQPRREMKMPSAAEYVAGYLAGGAQFADVRARLEAAAPAAPYIDDESAPSILPTPILQPVYNNFVGRRPVVDACGVKAMPGGGQVFIRPEVTTNSSMAIQSAENAALQASTLIVTKNQVTKNAYGGYSTLSEQLIDWSDPNIISILLDDMARIYANTTDNVAADALVAGTTEEQAFGAAVGTSPTLWAAFVANCASTILSGSNGNLPDTLFVSPNMWKNLMLLVDTTGRPLFSQYGPMNAMGNVAPQNYGGVAFGLNVVVDRNFATDTVIVGQAGGGDGGFEIFEQVKGALSIEVPSTRSRTISWMGYFATLMIDPSKFVKATFA